MYVLCIIHFFFPSNSRPFPVLFLPILNSPVLLYSILSYPTLSSQVLQCCLSLDLHFPLFPFLLSSLDPFPLAFPLPFLPSSIYYFLYYYSTPIHQFPHHASTPSSSLLLPTPLPLLSHIKFLLKLSKKRWKRRSLFP